MTDEKPARQIQELTRETGELAEEDAQEVRGGFSDIQVSHQNDCSSPTNLGASLPPPKKA
jgi:hypothetical protein